jgi:hypothetical protein
MLTPVSRLVLFVSSFAPLFAIWGVRLLPSRISVLPFAVFAIGVIGTYGVLYLKRTEEGRVDQIESAKPRDTESAAYLVTYVIPLALPTTDWRDWVAVSLFLLLVAVLYLRSGMDYINPMLALIGYHLYEARLRDDQVVWLVSRLKLGARDQVNTVNLVGDIWLAKSKINGG